ncbi:MAG: hypothetical protein ACXWMK_12565 [Syntrophales bacterium]
MVELCQIQHVHGITQVVILVFVEKVKSATSDEDDSYALGR